MPAPKRYVTAKQTPTRSNATNTIDVTDLLPLGTNVGYDGGFAAELAKLTAIEKENRDVRRPRYQKFHEVRTPTPVSPPKVEKPPPKPPQRRKRSAQSVEDPYGSWTGDSDFSPDEDGTKYRGHSHSPYHLRSHSRKPKRNKHKKTEQEILAILKNIPDDDDMDRKKSKKHKRRKTPSVEEGRGYISPSSDEGSRTPRHTPKQQVTKGKKKRSKSPVKKPLFKKSSKNIPMLERMAVSRKTLVILHETQLLWILLQLIIILSLFSKIDWDFRLRAPLYDLPDYSAARMPPLPGQISVEDRVRSVWISFTFVYITLALFHLAFFLDYIPPLEQTGDRLIDPTVMQTNMKKLTKHKSWYEEELYDQHSLPRKRQFIAFIMVMYSVIQLCFNLFILLYDLFYFAYKSYWRRTLDNWLSRLQKYYFLNFLELKSWIPSNEYLPAHHNQDSLDTPILIIDIIQTMFSCCGRRLNKGYLDWQEPHIYRPLLRSIRKAQGILIEEEWLHHYVAPVNNMSVPFSCCRWEWRSEGLVAPDTCDTIYGSNPNSYHSEGCVEPLIDFFLGRWMMLHFWCLLMVTLLMIPQLILFFSTFDWLEFEAQTRNGLYMLFYLLDKGKSRVGTFSKEIRYAWTDRLRQQSVRVRQLIIGERAGDVVDDTNQLKNIYDELAAAEAELYRPRSKGQKKRRRRRRRRIPTTARWRFEQWRPRPKWSDMFYERPPWRYWKT